MSTKQKSAEEIRKEQEKQRFMTILNIALPPLLDDLYSRLLNIENEANGVSSMLDILEDNLSPIAKIAMIVDIAKDYGGKSNVNDNDKSQLFKFYQSLTGIKYEKHSFIEKLEQIIKYLPTEAANRDEPLGRMSKPGESPIIDGEDGSLIILEDQLEWRSKHVKPVISDAPSLRSAPSETSATTSSVSSTLTKLDKAVKELLKTTNSSGIGEIASVLNRGNQSTQELFEGLISIAKERLGQGDNAPKNIFGQAALRFRAANRNAKIDALYNCLACLESGRLSDQDISDLNQRIADLPVPSKAKAQSSGILSALASELSVLASGLSGGLGLFGAPAAKTMSEQQANPVRGLKSR